MNALNVVAVASSEETRAALMAQLQSLSYVQFDGVLIELSDAARQCQQKGPDVIIVELTGRELDAGLFIEAITMNPVSPCVLFALHRRLDHQIILEAVRRGAKEFIQYPDDPKSLEEALKKHLTILNRVQQNVRKERGTGKLITVFGAKGGAGTSTLAVNLSHEIHRLINEPQGSSVALLDLDQVFNNTAVMLNLRPSHALCDLAQTPANEVDDALLRKITLHHESGVDILVGSKSVMDENELISAQLLERVLEYLLGQYSFVLVDLPTHVLDPYHQYLVERAEQIVLVSCLDLPSLYRTRQYLDLAKQYLDTEKIKLILNRWNLRGAYGMANKNLEEEFRFPVFARLPNDWDLNVEANSLGCVLGKVNANADLVKAIKKAASLLAGVDLPEVAPQKRQGLLGRIFNLKLLNRKEDPAQPQALQS
jgi:pilus assembly protein CpaE